MTTHQVEQARREQFVRYRLVSPDEARRLLGEVGEALGRDNTVQFLLDFEDEAHPQFVGADGGEPEDQLFCRDWEWVVAALNDDSAKAANAAYELQQRIEQLEAGILKYGSHMQVCDLNIMHSTSWRKEHGWNCTCGYEQLLAPGALAAKPQDGRRAEVNDYVPCRNYSDPESQAQIGDGNGGCNKPKGHDGNCGYDSRFPKIVVQGAP